MSYAMILLLSGILVVVMQRCLFGGRRGILGIGRPLRDLRGSGHGFCEDHLSFLSQLISGGLREARNYFIGVIYYVSKERRKIDASFPCCSGGLRFVADPLVWYIFDLKKILATINNFQGRVLISKCKRIVPGPAVASTLRSLVSANNI
jgi:hypothetical protein